MRSVCESFARNRHLPGDERRDWQQPRQLIVRCWAEFPTLLVMKEQHRPWCSDWTSITKAGWNGARLQAEWSVTPSRLLWSAQANVRLTRRDREQAKRLIGLAQKGKARGRAPTLVLVITPETARRRVQHLRQRKTDDRNEGTLGAALIGGRHDEQASRPQAPDGEDCLRSQGPG